MAYSTSWATTTASRWRRARLAIWAPEGRKWHEHAPLTSGPPPNQADQRRRLAPPRRRPRAPPDLDRRELQLRRRGDHPRPSDASEHADPPGSRDRRGDRGVV